MNVHLGEKFDKFVAELIAEGEYQSQSEVIQAALRLLREQEELRKFRLEELRHDIQKGLDSLARGEGTRFDVEEIKAQGRKKLAARRQNGAILTEVVN